MKNRIPIVMAALLILSLFACKSPEEKKMMQTLEDYISENAQMYDSLYGQMMDTTKVLYDSVRSVTAFFKSYSGDFPENDSLMQAFYQMGTVEKTFKHYIGRRVPALNEELEDSKTHMSDLHHDIKSGMLSDSQRNSYFHTEDSIHSLLTKKVQSRLEYNQKHIEKYFHYRNTVLILRDSLIERLKTQVDQ